MTDDIARDYGDSGLTIRTAFLDHAKRFPDKRRRPRHILWHGLRIRTADELRVPPYGRVRCEFLSSKPGLEQGFDLDVDGWLELALGERVPLLRTWHAPSLESAVEYPFHSKDGLLRVWNVYRMEYGGGQRVEEKWTENAGMWVEELSHAERIYHCSHGMARPPDFDCLIFKITVRGDQGRAS